MKPPKANNNVSKNKQKNQNASLYSAPSPVFTLPPDAKTNMRIFFDSMDWSALWEQFSLSINPVSGIYKYPTIGSLKNAHNLTQEQDKFVSYYLGPELADNPLKARYPFATPQDWIKKRRDSGWFSANALRDISKGVAAELSALDALRGVGNKFLLPHIARLEQIALQLDSAFAGQLMLSDLSVDANLKRTENYIKLHKQLQSMRSEAVLTYGKSLGISFEDTNSLANLIAASALAAASRRQESGHEEKSKSEVVMQKLLEMTLNKSAKHKLPLPEDITDVVIDVQTDEPSNAPKKKNVQ